MSFSRRPNPVFSESYAAIREVVIGARRAANLSQAQLAGRLGKSKSHIARIECGERRLDTLELYHMARAFGIAPPVLFAAVAERLEGATREP